MIFKHKKLSESVVMREFEKVAIAKKMVKVEEPIITKEASASYQPSNNLIDDMLKLANGLRSRGFEKDASSLEEKVLTYKLAETHLYRAIDEDAEDMLEFAHPKKDKIVFDAANGDGEIEDTLSQHKKILDIVNKQPKKVAFDVLAETADILGLKKKADANTDSKASEVERLVQTSTPEVLVANISYLKPLLTKIVPRQGALYTATNNPNYVLAVGIGSTLWSLVEGINGNYFTPHESEQFEINYLEFYRKANNLLGIQWQDSFTNKDSDFRRLFAKKEYVDHANLNLTQIYNEFKEKLENLSEMEIGEKSSVGDIDKFVNAAKSLISGQSWFALRGLTNNDYDLEGKIRHYLDQLTENAEALSKKISATQPVASGSGMDEILTQDRANMIAWRFSSVIDKAPESNTPPSKKYFQNISDTIKNYVGKPYSALYSDLVSKIDVDFKDVKSINDLDANGELWRKQYKVASNVNSLVKMAVKPGGAAAVTEPTRPASYNRPTGRSAGRSAVKTQNINPEERKAVLDMQTSLSTFANNLNEFHFEEGLDLKKFKSELLAGGIDGIWGNGTENALKSLNDSRVFGLFYLKSQYPDQMTEAAKENSKKLNEFLKAKGVNVKNKNLYLDHLQKDSDFLGNTTPTTQDVNGVGLTNGNLSSFSNLFNFIRLQFSQTNNWDDGGLNYNNWKTILIWFNQRAQDQQKLLNDSSDESAKTANANYIVLINNLWAKLNKFYAASEKNPNKVISPSELDGNSTSSSTNGPTQNAAYNTNNGNNANREGADFQTGEAKSPETPPFTYGPFPLDALKEKYTSAMKNYNQYKQYLGYFGVSINAFSESPEEIASKYIKRLTPEQVLSLNNISPTDQLGNGKNTYADLMGSYWNSFVQGSPTGMILQKKANYLVLKNVIDWMREDLGAVAQAYEATNPPTVGYKAMDNIWNKWSDTLKEASDRTSQAYIDLGRAPRINFS